MLVFLVTRLQTTARQHVTTRTCTAQALRDVTENGDSVRISGWLMFDPLHYDHMWQYDSPSNTRGTKARITRIEAFRNGAWRSLDTPRR